MDNLTQAIKNDITEHIKTALNESAIKLLNSHAEELDIILTYYQDYNITNKMQAILKEIQEATTEIIKKIEEGEI